MSHRKKGFVNFLQEFSIPLIAGVFVALLHANDALTHLAGLLRVLQVPEGVIGLLDHEGYHHILHWKPLGDVAIFGHALDLHFLINDIFMVFFFGIAAKEITEACLPGGSLNPIAKAINPLFATIGGVVGPVGVFFAALWVSHSSGAFPADAEWGVLQKGWGIPTATDIALAWLVARAVFGAGHPAINFLLLLAVADDAIGLAIIAIFYGDPVHPAEPMWLLLVAGGMAAALGLRLSRVNVWFPYIFLAGPIAWSGLVLANLHPALALVFIVPFLPGPKRDTGLYIQADEVDEQESVPQPDALHAEHSPLHLFEHNLKLFVDLGLFFFAYGNAGVAFAVIGPMTWIILGSLVVGKTLGIGLFGWLGMRLGFPLPERMAVKQLAMAGFIAALGLTVALFVAGAAFTDANLQGQAKMGALFSGLVGLVAVIIARPLGMRDSDASASRESEKGEDESNDVKSTAVEGVSGPLPTGPSAPLQQSDRA